MESNLLKYKKRKSFSQAQNFKRGRRNSNPDFACDQNSVIDDYTPQLISKQTTLKNKLVKDLQRNNYNFCFEQNNYIDTIPFIIPLNAKKAFYNV